MKFIIPIFFFILFVSCKNETNVDKDNCNSQNKKYSKIIESSAINIDITSNELYNSGNSYTLKRNDTTFLFRSYHMSGAIEEWDWTNKKLTNKIRLSFEGPNRVKGVMAGSFFPISRDSIFLPSVVGRIYLQHKDSIIHKNYFSNYKKRFMLSSTAEHKITKFDDKLLVSNGMPFVLPTKKSNWIDFKPMVFYDLKKDTLQEINLSFPKKYHDKCWTFLQANVSFTKYQDKLVFTFGASEDIFITNLDSNSKLEVVKCAKSKFVNQESKSIDCDDFDDYKEAIKIKSIPHYFAIEYDSYKDVFYKITLLPANEDDSLSNEPWDLVMPFSIMVLDNNFEVIDEISLPAKKFYIRDFFVTDEGLWISNNNPLNQNSTENKLIYTLFKLQ